MERRYGRKPFRLKNSPNLSDIIHWVVFDIHKDAKIEMEE